MRRRGRRPRGTEAGAREGSEADRFVSGAAPAFPRPSTSGPAVPRRAAGRDDAGRRGPDRLRSAVGPEPDVRRGPRGARHV